MLICTLILSSWSFLLFIYLFWGFFSFTVPGVWHSVAVREQALHYKSGGIYFCHPQHLPGHYLPVQLPATDHGRRPRVKHHCFPQHIFVSQLHYLNSYQTQRPAMKDDITFWWITVLFFPPRASEVCKQRESRLFFCFAFGYVFLSIQSIFHYVLK